MWRVPGGLVLRNTSFGRYVLDCPSFFYPIIFKYGAVGCTRRVRIIRPWTSLATGRRGRRRHRQYKCIIIIRRLVVV
jgi:hypothetical protein